MALLPAARTVCLSSTLNGVKLTGACPREIIFRSCSLFSFHSIDATDPSPRPARRNAWWLAPFGLTSLPKLNNSTERTTAGSGGVLLSDFSPVSEIEKISTMLEFQYAVMINFEACFAGLRGRHDMAEISDSSGRCSLFK